MSHDREWDVLASAARQITEGMCLSCPTRTWKLRWSPTHNRWQLVILHRIRCRATRTMAERRRADEFLHSLLMFYGCGIGDYNEDDMILHTRVVML